MYSDFIKSFQPINDSRTFSQGVLKLIRDELKSSLGAHHQSELITVVTTGSFGRNEASKESDLDFFIFIDDENTQVDTIEVGRLIQQVVDTHIQKDSGSTSTFGQEAILSFNQLSNNIGGKNDSNEMMTRRLLFLLEATWLFGEHRFTKYRNELIKCYVKDTDPDNVLSRFLLNDIIRYYRTIATDFEYKTTEQGQKWGLRSIKLRFSRKLLYFGGIIAVAETANQPVSNKYQTLANLLELTPLERIHKLSGATTQTRQLFEHYSAFLQAVRDEPKRAELEGVSKPKRNESALYEQLRHDGADFSKTLHSWLQATYPSEHDIHHALIY